MLGFKLVLLKTEAVSKRNLSSSSLSKFCFFLLFFLLKMIVGNSFVSLAPTMTKHRESQNGH